MYILAYFYHSLDFSKHSHQFWIIFVSSIFDEKYPPIFLRYFRYIRKIQVPIYPYLPIFQSLCIWTYKGHKKKRKKKKLLTPLVPPKYTIKFTEERLAPPTNLLVHSEKELTIPSHQRFLYHVPSKCTQISILWQHAYFPFPLTHNPSTQTTQNILIDSGSTQEISKVENSKYHELVA